MASTNILKPQIHVEKDPQSVAVAVASWFSALVNQASSRFTVCLSGGTTPKIIYETLSKPPFSQNIPWTKVHWFWGDERFVPKTDPASNYKMVFDALFSSVPVPAKNIHVVQTELENPQQAALAYEKELKDYYGAPVLEAPLFDVNFLGLGEDGHTASLFPGSQALEETTRWASAVVGVKPESRVSLTFPVLDSSQYVVFVVTGQNKSDILSRLKKGDMNLPASRIRPVGELHWYIDQAASSAL